jgi:hemoglobin
MFDPGARRSRIVCEEGRMRLNREGLALVLSVATLLGCASKGTESASTPPDQATETTAADKSLYDRLGGEAAIRAVVDEFVANVAADARINKFFAKTDIDKLKGHLVNQIGQASGGPQVYTGRDMKTAHAGMGVDDAAFNALVEDLVKALDKFSVPAREKDDLLAVLGPMKADVVTK